MLFQEFFFFKLAFLWSSKIVLCILITNLHLKSANLLREMNFNVKRGKFC